MDFKIECPKCGAENNRSARRCRCGRILSRAWLRGPKKLLPVWIVLAVAAGRWAYSSYQEGTRDFVPLLACAGFGVAMALVPLFVEWRDRL